MRIGVPGWLRERWGVRAAAALAATAFVAAAVALAAVALVLLQERSVRESVGEEARAHADRVADRLAAGESPALAVRPELDGFVVMQVVGTDGSVLAASPQLAGLPPLRAAHPGVPAEAREQSAAVLAGEPLLVVEQEVTTPSGVRFVLAGRSAAAAERSTETVTELALVGAPLLALVAGAATYAFTRRALRPVEAIRAQAAALTDLSRRVPEPFARDEVGRLARTMNAMLARLETAQIAQRRFVADASHELRSPLTTIIVRLELGQRRGPTAADVAVMMPEAQRVARLIDDLLLLARADERGLTPGGDDVDLDELVEVEAARLRTSTHAHVRIDTVPVRVTGDRTQLARALRNLADNAARHAEDRVALRLRREDGDAVLQVADDGPGIPAADRRQVFERFVRLDEGRAREAGGTGLGLAIVAEVVAAHGGRVEVRGADDGGALFEVRLPAQPAPRPASPAGSGVPRIR
jgi:signal transduction histidine kinase